MKTMNELITDIQFLRRFMPTAELDTIIDNIRSEEGEYFHDLIVEWAAKIRTMPKTYEQDGKGEEAVAHLHYFSGSGDWYITEKDQEAAQHQAFGLADFYHDGGELGYISIVELIRAGIELDVHWTPKTLREIRKESKVTA
jgi:hypothetical protein